MIGVDTELLYELDDLGKCREQALVVRTPTKLSESKLPIYMSIDKDVLHESITSTNWDQGNMSLEELDEWIDYILDNRYLIGADICGEADFEAPEEAHHRNSEINGHLYERLFNNQWRLVLSNLYKLDIRISIVCTKNSRYLIKFLKNKNGSNIIN